MGEQTGGDLREEVRTRYAGAARAVLEPKAGVVDIHPVPAAAWDPR